MLKNVTIGRYFPGDSVIHRANASVKLILTILYMVFLLMLNTVSGMLWGIVILIVAYISAGIPFKMVIGSIRPMIPIVVVTGLLNMFLIDGDAIFSFWIFTLTKQGLLVSILLILRILCLIAGTSILTYTTTPIDLTDGIETLLSPLKKLHFPVHELAMMMTIALRFIPTLIDETGKIMNAQKARGADFESGNFIERGKALIPILIPLFVSSFRRADELALAMESRCYQGGEGRTKLKESKLSSADFFCTAFMIIMLALTFIISARFPMPF